MGLNPKIRRIVESISPTTCVNKGTHIYNHHRFVDLGSQIDTLETRIKEGEKLLCRKCEKQHLGRCMASTCYRCGHGGHIAQYYTARRTKNLVDPPKGPSGAKRPMQTHYRQGLMHPPVDKLENLT